MHNNRIETGDRVRYVGYGEADPPYPVGSVHTVTERDTVVFNNRANEDYISVDDDMDAKWKVDRWILATQLQ